MLNKFLHLLGRSFGIMMGWRRTHRPGDLTARIFIEHDRLISGAAKNLAAIMHAPRTRMKSLLPQTPVIKATRVAIRADRISLVADRAVARVARSVSSSPIRENRRVVWLSAARQQKPVGKTLTNTAGAHLKPSNIIALHKKAPGLKTNRRIAA